jgi:hypothetical protein
MSADYILDIVSLDKNIEGKQLKKYSIDNTDFIGAFENEPFEIVFKNNTHKKVQVVISVDGTDILTGKLASTEPSGKMWLVNGYDSLRLKAWPETNSGGARFVFTNTDNSVAANTHGNLSSKGIIAVAVFEEGHVYNIAAPNYTAPNYWYRSNPGFLLYDYSITCNNTISKSSAKISQGNITRSFCSTSASVGAGEYVQQEIINTAGLIKPRLATTIRVKYEWWSSLRSKLRKIGEERAELQSTNGFPGDKKNIDLARIPRVKSSAKRQEYSGKINRSRRRNRNYTEFQRFV